MPLNTAGPFIVGVVLIIIIVFVTKIDKNPSPIAAFAYRVVIAIAAALIATGIPGVINVHISQGITAGGAIAVFVIVYWFNAAQIEPKPPKDEEGERKGANVHPVPMLEEKK